jgi:hypothetical protein
MLPQHSTVKGVLMKKVFILGLLMFSIIASGANSFKLWPGLTTSKKWLDPLLNVSQCITANDAFLKEVGNYPKYTFTTLTPKQVEESLRKTSVVATLSTYSPPWYNKKSNTIAYRNVGDSTIYFNIYRNPRAYEEMINTVIHEWTHIAGHDHGDSNWRGKEDSVPYRVGKIAEKYVGVCK